MEMERLVFLEEGGSGLQHRHEANTSLRALFRTWPRKGIQRGAVLAALGGYRRTLVVGVGVGCREPEETAITKSAGKRRKKYGMWAGTELSGWI
ncbi:hypothetical protein V6N13_017220 [Hibiscus sabdariffa]|uniref:Uncharacterized protein n=2 Tax=Hibiscus sabdariffa TaxID=183260 RepID=A0ABR1ZB80_9ROSI